MILPRRKRFSEKEIQILEKLVDDGRMTYTHMAKELGMSPAGVMKKVKKLESLGIIKKYTAIVDHAKLGKGYKYIILLKTEPGKHKEVAKKILNAIEENVLEIHEITGPYDVVVKVIAGDQVELNSILQRILEIPGIKESNTSLVLDTIIERISIVPADLKTKKITA